VYENRGYWRHLGNAKRSCWHCLETGWSGMKLLASFGGWVMWNEAAGIVWRVGDTKQSCWHCFEVGWHETKLLALFGGWVTWNKAAGIVWRLGDTKQSCWHCLGVGWCETKPFALSGGWVIWKRHSQVGRSCKHLSELATCKQECYSIPHGSLYSRASSCYSSPLHYQLQPSRIGAQSRCDVARFRWTMLNWVTTNHVRIQCTSK